MKARWLLLPLCLLLVAAGPSRKQDKAWRAVVSAEEKGDDARLVEASEAFLADHGDADEAGEARLLAGGACLRLERWAAARRHFSRFLDAGGFGEGLHAAKHGLAIALAREGRGDEAAPALRSVASSDPDLKRARQAARELVALHLFEGRWKEALAAQELLVERDLFRLPEDLEDSRKAAQFLSDEALAQLQDVNRDRALGALLGLLALDRDDALVATATTEGARRSFVARYGESPLVQYVPGAEDFGTEADTNADRIGVLLPLSGKYGGPGQLARRGFELAIKQRTALKLPDVELVFADTASDPKTAVRELESLANEHKVLAVLGPLVADEAEAVAPRAMELGVPLLMMTQRHGIADGLPGVFNTWGTAEEQVDALVDYATSEGAMSRFVVLYPGHEGGASLADRFWKRVAQGGGGVAAIEDYDVQTTDFRQVARELTGSQFEGKAPAEEQLRLAYLPTRDKPQVDTPVKAGVDFQGVFVPDGYKRVAMLGPALLYEEVNVGGMLDRKEFPAVSLLGIGALHHPDFPKHAADVAEGAIAATSFDPRQDDPTVAAFVKECRSTFGAPPTVLEATAHDATAFVLQLRAEGATTRRELRSRLERATPQTTVMGSLGFAADGEMRHQVRVLKVKKGRWRAVWPPKPPAEP